MNAPERHKKPMPNSTVDEAGKNWIDWLKYWLGILPNDPRRTLRESDIRAIYQTPDSFTDFMPWAEYSPDSKSFLFADGISVGALFELRPVDAEARPDAWIEEVRSLVMQSLHTIPERETNPWIVQFFLQDEPLLAMASQLQAYIDTHASWRKEDTYPQAFIDMMEAHLQRVSRKGGIFTDDKTGTRWGGRYRRVRMTLYRNFKGEKWPEPDGTMPSDELNEVAERLTATLAGAGVNARRATGKDMYEWMLPWLSPNPHGLDSPLEYLAQMPFPSDEALRDPMFYFDIASAVMPHRPDSSQAKQGLWYFQGRPHRILMFDAAANPPQAGQWTLPLKSGNQGSILFDELPTGAIVSQTIVVQVQDHIRSHLEHIRESSFGDRAEAAIASRDADTALWQMAEGNKLFPMLQGVYLSGENEQDLRSKTNKAIAALRTGGLRFIEPKVDLIGLDSYVYNLPFGYASRFDRPDKSDPAKRKSRRYALSSYRERLQWSQYISGYAPIYGKGAGTGHPGMCFFNSDGMPLMVDPLNKNDRQRNAHSLILGPTGAGKSATCNWLLMSMMAAHKPYLYIIDAGGSFELLGQYFQSQGLKVHHVKLTPDSDVSLPPFADAIRLLDENRDTSRDYMGEMEIAARLMITGGEKKEEEHFRRHMKSIVQHAIKLAAVRTRDDGREQVMVSDVVAALSALGKGEATIDTGEALEDFARADAAKMGHAMNVFAQDGEKARYFNRPAHVWPEADITIVDVGILAGEGYEDALAVCYIGLMNRINSAIEARRYSNRQSIILNDEAHITTTNPLLAPFLAKAAKMWRKWGAWLWLATQNLEDFPDDSKKILNMTEWWLCLSMPHEEIKQISRFRNLSDEEKTLLLSADKEPGKYVEGVILSGQITTLFRNVPPAIPLALAMTEQHERARRKELMDQHGCSELEAALMIARDIEAQRDQGGA